MNQNRIEVTRRIYGEYIREVRMSLPSYARPTFDRLSRTAQEMAARRAFGSETILNAIEKEMKPKLFRLGEEQTELGR